MLVTRAPGDVSCQIITRYYNDVELSYHSGCCIKCVKQRYLSSKMHILSYVSVRKSIKKNCGYIFKKSIFSTGYCDVYILVVIQRNQTVFYFVGMCWPLHIPDFRHYRDSIMNMLASLITNLTIVYSTLYSGAYWNNHQSYASLAFERGIPRRPVNFPHKGPVTQKMFTFDDVIIRKKMSGDVCFTFCAS